LHVSPSKPQPHAVLLLQQGNCRSGQLGHPEATHLQLPLWQDWPLAHAKPDPQPPQLFLSVCSLTQAPLQSV
jgi:hypothetical protein